MTQSPIRPYTFDESPTSRAFDTASRICETHNCCIFGGFRRIVQRAEVAELADARGSGPRTRKGVGVRVPSSAPNKSKPHRMSRLRVARVV